GPVLLEQSLPIGLHDNATTLAARLSALTAALLVEALPRIAAAGPGPELERWRRLKVRPQAQEGINYARLLQREDQRIDWGSSALAVHRRIQGLHPGAFALWRGKRLKLLASEPLVRRLAKTLGPEGLSPEARALAERWGLAEGEASAAAPGTVLAVEKELGLVVATGGCPLLLREAQLEGKPAAAGGRLLQQLGATVGEQLRNGS
ncbi:MAG: methionyl-tRNA formyltransferase, partial [Cyanobium sp.]